MDDEVLFSYFEPILGRRIDVTYEMLSAQSKRDWDIGVFKDSFIKTCSLKVEGEREPCVDQNTI